MRESTSFSRALNTEIESVRREAPRSWVTTSGSSAVPPEATRTQGLDEVAHVGHPVLEQVADAGGVVGQQLGGVAGLDVLREQQDPETLVWRRSSMAARRPSSVKVGGMRMSTTATSGRSCSTDRRRASGSPTAPVMTKPRSTRSWTSPSRRMAESSAMTTRSGSGGGHLGVQRRSTVTTVGPRGGLTMSSRPSTACTRSVRPTSPLDDDPMRESYAPPVPSSRTTTRSHPPCSVHVMLAREAWACWATLASSSATQK